MQDPPNVGFGMTGVAQEANIYMYKVFSCVYDYTADDLIMAGMIQAAADGVNVISLSLGGEDPFQILSPYTDLVNSLTGQGIAVVAANGNDAYYGLYTQSSPGSVEGVLAVGSVTNVHFPNNYNMKDSLGNSYQYQAVWPLILPQAITVYSHGLECTPAAWENTAAAVTDPSNTIIIVGVTGDCGLATQMSAADAYGLKFLIAYNVAQDPVSQDAELETPFEVITLVVDPRTGASLLRHIKLGTTYQISFTDPTVSSSRLLTGGMLSNYSTFSPTWDTVALKPQLSMFISLPFPHLFKQRIPFISSSRQKTLLLTHFRCSGRQNSFNLASGALCWLRHHLRNIYGNPFRSCLLCLSKITVPRSACCRSHKPSSVNFYPTELRL